MCTKMSVHACTPRTEPKPISANLNPDTLSLTIVVVIPPLNLYGHQDGDITIILQDKFKFWFKISYIFSKILEKI